MSFQQEVGTSTLAGLVIKLTKINIKHKICVVIKVSKSTARIQQTHKKKHIIQLFTKKNTNIKCEQM